MKPFCRLCFGLGLIIYSNVLEPDKSNLIHFACLKPIALYKKMNAKVNWHFYTCYLMNIDNINPIQAK